jgi:hypothetical protein
VNKLYTLGRSPIVVDKVKIALADYPDKEAAFKLLHGLEYGFKLNYSGPRIRRKADFTSHFAKREPRPKLCIILTASSILEYLTEQYSLSIKSFTD